jgi:hypothetical protein
MACLLYAAAAVRGSDIRHYTVLSAGRRLRRATPPQTDFNFQTDA